MFHFHFGPFAFQSSVFTFCCLYLYMFICLMSVYAALQIINFELVQMAMKRCLFHGNAMLFQMAMHRAFMGHCWSSWGLHAVVVAASESTGVTKGGDQQTRQSSSRCTVVPSVPRMTHSPYASPSIAVLSSKLSILHPASPTISMSMILLDIWSLVAIQLHKNCKSWLLPTSIFNARL